jgi:hypothetical protein
MVITYNGMLATELGEVRWQKSWHSNPNGECVELAALPTGEIAMRNSRFPAGPILLYTQAEIGSEGWGVRPPNRRNEPSYSLVTALPSGKRRLEGHSLANWYRATCGNAEG